MAAPHNEIGMKTEEIHVERIKEESAEQREIDRKIKVTIQKNLNFISEKSISNLNENTKSH